MNDTKVTKRVSSFAGTCPICSSGDIVDGDEGFRCNDCGYSTACTNPPPDPPITVTADDHTA